MRKFLLIISGLFVANLLAVFVVRWLFQWEPLAGFIAGGLYVLGLIYTPYEKLTK